MSGIHNLSDMIFIFLYVDNEIVCRNLEYMKVWKEFPFYQLEKRNKIHFLRITVLVGTNNGFPILTFLLKATRRFVTSESLRR